jgi:hypothetical protein
VSLPDKLNRDTVIFYGFFSHAIFFKSRQFEMHPQHLGYTGFLALEEKDRVLNYQTGKSWLMDKGLTTIFFCAGIWHFLF